MWIAIYEYDAQGEDELQLRKGDIIDVLSKDYRISGDDGWWTGKCNGKVGVFPYNFVAPIDQDFSNLPREELLGFNPPHIGFHELNVAEVIGSNDPPYAYYTAILFIIYDRKVFTRLRPFGPPTN